MHTGHAKDFVRNALYIGALELLPKGRVLKSGRISPYFFNSALFNTGQRVAILASAYAEAMRPIINTVEATYGPPYKGIILSASVASAIWHKYAKDVGYSFSLKEAKDHGEGGMHVGAILTNKGVAIVDDVITTGGSACDAVAYVRKEGGFPTVFVIGFDRQEHGVTTALTAVQSFVSDVQIPVLAAATLADLIEVLTEDTKERIPLGKETLPHILAYQSTYAAQ